MGVKRICKYIISIEHIRTHMRNVYDNGDTHSFTWNTPIGRALCMLVHAMQVQHHTYSLHVCSNYAYDFTYMFRFACSKSGRGGRWLI